MTEKDERSGDWQKSLEKPEQIEFDHPLYNHAPKIGWGIGGACAIAMYIWADVPWWMPLFVAVVVATLVIRVLRPRTRGFQIEDEI